MFKNKLLIILFFLTNLSSLISKAHTYGLSEERWGQLQKTAPAALGKLQYYLDYPLLRGTLEKIAKTQKDSVNACLENMDCFNKESLTMMTDRSGKTALEIAEKAGHAFFLNLLQEHKNQCAQQSKTITEFQECMEEFKHPQEQKSDSLPRTIV